ncbi:M48 family peptidase [Lysobacter sp. TY2-98]|uniref:M48 family metallopeptidase n=1 Tax=Lysobacter sp. TY2-98 TaxID=2290922 RepID=UPI000E208BF0|nr:M48 family metallopeptidase [Lysobacter sp. TY2-98]AXK72828.1 M48 family peptidase [Lysobacter sp. TY2-98]
MKPALLATALTFTLAALCGVADARQPLHLVSDAQLAQMGQDEFAKMKATQKMSTDTRQQAAVACVVNSLRAVLPAPYSSQQWEARVFVDDTPNAFALPGGKVGVNTGMFKVVQSQDELAAVLGHEMGHIVARHTNERVSRQLLTQTGVQLLGAVASHHASAATTRGLVNVAGAGGQLFFLLPNSRTQEAEADALGQRYMAQAGFDPARAVTLWQHMDSISKSRPPQFLSTHPNPANRLHDLSASAPALQPVAAAARRAGRNPKCF